MEQDILLKDVLPYIWAWTLTIAFVLLVLAYRLWCFGKQHPEIFQPDATSADKQMCRQKAELRRQYHNQSMISISFIFIWVIGMIAICFGFNGFQLTFQGWFVVGFAVLIIIWMLSMIQCKPNV